MHTGAAKRRLNMKVIRALASSAVLLAALYGQALAQHTPFMKPANFHPTSDMVSVQAAYSRDIFCPALGVSSPDFQILGPGGTPRAFARISVETFETMLDAPLPSHGTYRFTTGEMYGDIANMIYSRGEWRPVRPGERVRTRARTQTMRTVTVADAYVTRGEPTRAPLDTAIGRLAIRPITHPNQITAGDGFDAELLFNGAPFPNMPFVLYEPGQSEDDMERSFVTDERGRAHITFERPGLYVAAARFRTQAPEGSGVDVYGYSTSLTLEVQAAPPASP
jgi:hypothetical protein